MNFQDVIKNKTGVSLANSGDADKNTDPWELLAISPSGKDNIFKHTDCPKCDKVALLSDVESGDYFCENCEFSGNVFSKKISILLDGKKSKIDKRWWSDIENPDPFVSMMNEKYNIDEETLNKLGIKYQLHYFKDKGKVMGSIVIPSFSLDKSYVNNYHFIPLSSKSAIKNNFESLNGNVIGLDTLNSENVTDPVYIVNSPLDYITLKQTDVDDSMKVICIPFNIDTVKIDDKSTWSFITNIEEVVLKNKKFVTLFTESEKNEKIKKELCRRLGFHLCGYVEFSKYKDVIPNIIFNDLSIFDIFQEGMEEAVRQVIDNPTNFPIEGLHQLNEYESDIDDIFENGLQPGFSWGYQQLDSKMTFKFGQFTIVTGIPGHGKSSFVEASLINMAWLHNFKIATFSPENTPIARFYVGMMQKASGKTYKKGDDVGIPRISREEHEYWKKWFDERFYSILPEEKMTTEDDFSIKSGQDSGAMTLGGVLSLAAKAVFRHGVKVVLIDPWTELDHQRPNGMTELEYLSKGISMIKMFAKAYDVHVIVVAHPTKLLPDFKGLYPVPTPYNIAGGALWRNKGDNIISVYRFVGQPDSDITDIYIQKIRFEECGSVGSFSIRADPKTNFYYDDIDQAKRIEVIKKKMSPDKEIAASVSIEETLSTSMRLNQCYNARKLPAQFNNNSKSQLSKEITTSNVIDDGVPF